MKISAKQFYEDILFGIGLIGLGAFISIKVDVWFIQFLGVGSIIFGIGLILDSIKNSQNEKTFEIKNKKIVFNYKEYPLDKLNLKILPYKTYKKVSLFYDKNFEPIFENVLFSEDEFKEFLNLIKPYLKKETSSEVIEIFEDGFSIYGSFFRFDEVNDIKLNYNRKRTGDFIEIILFLKDKTLSFVIENGYEKAMALKLKINKNCDYKDYSFIYIFLILGFILAISGDIYLTLFGFVILIISIIVELNFNEAYLKKLCEQINENNIASTNV